MTQLKKDNIPLYAEEQVINEEQSEIQKILNRFKQPIPKEFVQIEVDYIFTTKSKWNKPLCERYGFEYEGKWTQIDIPHRILEKLELRKGEENIDYFYLNPAVLTRSEIYGAITIENETEIFLDKPLTINSLEKSLTEWVIKINHLEEQIKDLRGEDEANQGIISNLQNEITDLKDWKNKVKFELISLLQPNSIYTEDTPSVEVLVEGVKELLWDLEIGREEVSQLENQISDKDKEIIVLKAQIQQKDQQITSIAQERDNRPNITLDQWNADYSQRPTKKELKYVKEELNELKDKLNPTWDKFLYFCRSYRIEEIYIGRTFADEFPNFMIALSENIEKNKMPALQVKNKWSSYNFANLMSIHTDYFQNNDLIKKVYDKWRSELYISYEKL